MCSLNENGLHPVKWSRRLSDGHEDTQLFIDSRISSQYLSDSSNGAYSRAILNFILDTFASEMVLAMYRCTVHKFIT